MGGPNGQFRAVPQQLTDDLNGGAFSLKIDAERARDAARGAEAAQQTDFNKFTPTLQTNFNQFAPKLGGALDQTSQLQLGQLTQGRNAQLGATQAQIGADLGRQNPGVARALQARAAVNNQLGANGDRFNVYQNQQGREFALSQQLAQLQGLGNQAQLQQSEAGAGLQAASNAARTNQAGLAAAPLQSQTSLLSALAGLADLFAPKRNG